MRASFDKWWLLPLGVFAASALVALGIVVFGPSFVGGSSAEVAQRAASEAAADCSGALSTDYACYQKRYRELVLGSGVEAAFVELKDEHTKDEFVRDNCHQLTHVIGRAAAELYGDLPTTYGWGDGFCMAGYYHGAMEAVVAKIGADQILQVADTLCSEMGERQRHSFLHYDCAHGLGHGFMGVLGNELFESLEACDALMDGWEREHCYNGVFMENLPDSDNRSHPSKYLKEDQPLYPCTVVEDRYKTQCYQKQTSYALKTQDRDFAKVFELCSTVEDAYRPTCYQSLGRDASGNSSSDVAKTRAACMQGQDYEARSNCVIGAVKDFISYYHSDRQASELCESFEADLREVCLETGEEYYKFFQA